jgi:hypothetical protein
MKMYIYKFTESGATDWICAPNKKKAIGIYEGDPNSAEIKRLTKHELKNSYITDPNQSEPYWGEYCGEDTEDDYSGGYKILYTLEEALQAYKKTKHTEIIATDNF